MDHDELMREVYDYLSSNLRVEVICKEGGGNYGYDRPGVEVTITLYNPYTGKQEVIANGSDSL